MKIVYSAVIALSLGLSNGAIAQTLATPPSSPKAKDEKTTLGEKINSIIKKQKPSAPATTTSAAKPATPVNQTTPAPKPAASTAAPAAAPSTETAEAKPSVAMQRQSKVDQLITEREQLVLKYDYLKTQESNFWGKASKEDLHAVIDALKDVLRKDEQIIHAVEQANLETRRSVAKRAAELEAESKKLNTQVKGDKRVITDNIYDLKASLANAQNLIKRKDRDVKDLEEQLQSAKDAKFEHDAIAAFFAMICLVLGGYIVRLRNKLASVRSDKNHVKA